MTDRFLIGGTGRSGTKWCATVLRAAGVYCGHKQVYTTGHLVNGSPVEWLDLEGDSSLAAVPYFETTEARTVLVTRHPLDTASSFLRVGPFKAGSQPEGLTSYLAVHYPEILAEPTELDAALRYWLIWTRLGVKHADVVLRLEDLDVFPYRRLLDACEVQARWHQYPIGRVNQGPEGERAEWWEVENSQLVDEIVDLCLDLGYVP